MRSYFAGLLCLALMAATAPAAARRPAEKPAAPDFTQGGQPDKFHDWTLGPTGARGWVYGWKEQTADARQILVTEVAKGSPADGLLAKGDVILGVGGKEFEDDARIQFARAITAAETEPGGGRLLVKRWRTGQTNTVELKLQVMGSYSDTAPFDCLKSKKIFEQGCEAIAKEGLKWVNIPNDMNALALLASGNPKYRPLVADYAKRVADDKGGPWEDGYANILLAEYLMATGDRSVFEGMRRIALASANGASAVGTWGHNFAKPDGNLNGYGNMNAVGLSLTISMVLAREAGVQDPVLDRTIEKSARFLRWYVDKGAIPYGDHMPWPDHDNNGKCAAAAVLFDLLGDRAAAEFFAKVATAAYSERENGHSGNYFNMLWALPGVIRCGPVASGAYLKETAWIYDLARVWDGSVLYQGEIQGGEDYGAYRNWDCTGSYLLAFAAPLKSLYLTGKQPACFPPLTPAQVTEVIADGREFFNTTNRYAQRTTGQLLAGLASWAPAVRGRSAEALARRSGDFVPLLIPLLTNANVNARYGACEALRCLGTRGDAAASQLQAALLDPDPWVQNEAALALESKSESVREASVNDLLRMTLTANPNDPRHITQRAASQVLFGPAPGDRTIKSILTGSVSGVDRQLLVPVVKSVLTNEDSVARGSVAQIYGELTDHELALLLPSILQASEKMAPSDEMFADGVRLAGVELLSQRHIREGLPLCFMVLEPDRWGRGQCLGKCFEALRRYGTHAQAFLPQLQQLRQEYSKSPSDLAQIDKLIADIKNAKTTPVLIGMAEFIARH